MSSVTEIEAAIELLPLEQQRQLALWFQSRSLSDPRTAGLPRDAWLSKLSRLRASIATGRDGSTAEAILDDLRSERG